MTEPNRPLVTFALFAYNQEKYIREAVEGAFSQTYEPLEIILSDDYSTDHTFQIMEKMAKAYQGPHLIKCNRNEENCGLIAHINKVTTIANGEIIVVAAGDDRSRPTRTENHIDVYQQNKDAAAVYSNTCSPGEPEGKEEVFSPKVQKINRLRTLISGGGLGAGATYSYRKDCFNWPDTLPENLKFEDRLLPLRAALLGTVYRIEARAVIYGLDLIDDNRVIGRHGLPGTNIPDYWEHHRLSIKKANEELMISSFEALLLIAISYHLEVSYQLKQMVEKRFPRSSKILWLLLSGPLRFVARLY